MCCDNSCYTNYFLWLLNSYTQNGLLHMIDRNKRIKPRPERFQATRDKFDILVTCEERVYDQVIEGTHKFFISWHILYTFLPLVAVHESWNNLTVK